MPEGHTVHRLARTLRELFDGERLRVTSPQGRFTDGAALLSGRRLVEVEAWGKQLFCAFVAADDGAGAEALWLRTHLGLYGAWTFAGAPGAAEVAHAIGAPRKRIGERETVLGTSSPGATAAASPAVGGARRDSRHVTAGNDMVVGEGGSVGRDVVRGEEWQPPGPRGQVRVRLLGRHAVADLTGPAACEVITSAEKDAATARLGPDPIRDGEPGHDADRFVAKAGRSRVAIGQLLMDQAVIAGVGNIYRAEALFRAGVDPLRPGRDVPASSARAIWDDLVVLMRDGARTGAIVTARPEDRSVGDQEDRAEGRRRTRQNTDGTPGAVPADRAFYVYHRDGLPCRVCGTPILLKELAGRNLFWCATCQA
ncbi:Fpg/Nei family DNA glycosylase [Myceligenerans pegani]|uniref:DNA-(apurinic or apyrimidinic site) lyase n=1 Tax=Myceligenerans pegani TaxID=2776917 RepID=A0ABR9MXB1_9MICO|nr:Fpg/Nei family DNA glycosylase [Myceligenerans sp. TRM 65318]MBE1876031.1 Fpg/Nei family DNA glycosylase [Myceligenerans sp. TRM 65318]MBE3018302.1 Fpg/Nei family DNA glycosylase [Myceligenerans sp. TRM 65318]